MLGPTGFFCFKHPHIRGNADAPQYAFAYKPPGPVSPGALDELMLAMCKGPHVPDAVVVVALSNEPNVDLRALLEAETAKVAQQRLKGRVPLVYAAYNLLTGGVQEYLLDDVFRGKRADLKLVIRRGVGEWIASGLEAVFDPADVVLRAPPGYAYQKPSGARSEIFLKADLALKSSANVAFVALALFHKLFAGSPEAFAELRTVYVDTMAIAPVAYALRDLLTLCGFKQPFNIESFHSWIGFDEVKRPLPKTSLCLISATTSMALHEQWIQRKEVDRSEVVTLLTLSTAPRGRGNALLALELPATSTSAGPAQLSIRIKGETFLPEQEAAKKVLLSDVHHRSDSDVSRFAALVGAGVFDIYRRPPNSGSKARALYVDGSKLIEQEVFVAWLSQQLLQSVKAATQLIVYQDDASSYSLAKRIAEACSSQFGLTIRSILPASRLVPIDFRSDDGVIICATVAGKGSQLLEISRSLRDLHEGPRLYVVGYQVAETRSELGTLLANLRHSKSVTHDVARFGAAAVGTQLLASYEQEYRTYYGPSINTGKLPGALARRGEVLGTTHPVASLALLPHGKEMTSAMRLKPGFAYWPPGFSAQACHAEALATIAVLLQRAREHDLLPDERRLSTASYRHVVLDPENFARFNDGVLQAALLRCCYPAELDYRGDYAASDFMKSLILRSMSRATQEAGEATLEFILALQMRRLQITDAHQTEVMHIARTRPASRPPKLQRALDFLLGRLGEAGGGKTKLPF